MKIRSIIWKYPTAMLGTLSTLLGIGLPVIMGFSWWFILNFRRVGEDQSIIGVTATNGQLALGYCGPAAPGSTGLIPGSRHYNKPTLTISASRILPYMKDLLTMPPLPGGSWAGVSWQAGYSFSYSQSIHDVILPPWAWLAGSAAMVGLGYPSTIGRLVRCRRLARRVRENRCLSCGYDLRASPDKCPECGTPVPRKENSNKIAADVRTV